MTIGEMLTDIYADAWHTSTPDTAVTDRIKRNLNKAHRLILRDPACARLRDTAESTVTFASEASRRVYGLTSALESVNVITERSSDRRLERMTLSQMRSIDPGRRSSGNPFAFAPLGYKPYLRSFASAGSGVWAASSAAGDTTQSLQINAVQASGIMTGDLQSTLTGTSRVAIGSTIADIVELQMVSLSAVAVGVVSLYDAAAAGNVIAQIGIGQKSPQYLLIELYPEPSSAITYYVDGTYRIPELDDTTDVPMLPEEFHDLMVSFALMREYEKATDPRLATAAAAFRTGFDQLRWAMNGGAMRVMGRGRPRFSRFGAWTPAESWDS